MEISHNNLMPKNAEKFYCEKCYFKCNKLSNWSTHLSTNKHKMEICGNVGNAGNVVIIDSYECNICNRPFKTNSGLWKHKKKCGIVQGTSAKNEIIPDIDKELLIKMLLKNSEVMEKMLDVIPQIGNITNNTNSHNTMNNQFNIQMFLNEHCKNAMNLTDFVQSLPITSATFDSTIENGLTKTITNMMLNGLSKLDILERPIHCTDASRKTLYVKEADVWEKDNELLHVINSIIYLSVKQRTLLNVWRDANEGWRTNDRLQNKMTYLLMNTMELIERDDKEKSKIIRSISKNVYLDSETKKLYM